MERFFKYEGIGNDFVVLDRRQSGRDIDAATAKAMCDRRLGIGGDGVLALLPSKTAAAKMVVHNADGSIAEMCGNGLRCAVKYLVDHSPQKLETIRVDTGAGILESRVHFADGEAREVEVNMGPARLIAPNLPSGKTGKPFLDAQLAGFNVRGSAVSMGNPHLVLRDVKLSEAGELGPRLELHPDFPDRTNVEFVEKRGAGLNVVVWERGCGLTQACGTGACAAAAVYVQRGELPAAIWLPVTLPGGTLHIRVAADLSTVELKGPARFVFEGVVPPPAAL